MAVVRKRVVLLGLRSLEQEIMFVAIWKEIQRAGERGREREREIPWVQREKDERDSLGPEKKREIPRAQRELQMSVRKLATEGDTMSSSLLAVRPRG